MIACPNCGTQNRRGSKYCCGCGQHLDPTAEITCPCCERVNTADARFCAFCGATLASAVVGEASSPSQEPQPTEGEAEAPLADGSDAGRPPGSGLPEWLYAPGGAPETASPDEGEPLVRPPDKGEPNKYLVGIDGLLPDTDVWLTKAQRSGTAGPGAG